MLRGFSTGYLALGVLYQYWAYGDASMVAVSTLVHVLFWPLILLATSFWYIVLAALFCLGVAIVYFVFTNHGVIREVMAKRNNPDSRPVPEYPPDVKP